MWQKKKTKQFHICFNLWLIQVMVIWKIDYKICTGRYFYIEVLCWNKNLFPAVGKQQHVYRTVYSSNDSWMDGGIIS